MNIYDFFKKSWLNIFTLLNLAILTGLLIYRLSNSNYDLINVITIIDIITLIGYLCFLNRYEKLGFFIAVFMFVIFIIFSTIYMPDRISKFSLILKLVIIFYMIYYIYIRDDN